MIEYLKLFISILGGGSVVAIGAILFVKNRLEQIIDKKVSYQFDAKLENEKGLIEKKIYVSQHKFDKEFAIIQELMERSFDFTYLSWNAYTDIGAPNGSEYEKYIEACDAFTIFYMKNCAFIPEELAKPFDLFVKKINEFRSAASKYRELLRRVGNSGTTSKTEDETFQKYIDIMRTIHDEINVDSDYCHDKLVKATRNYYKKLEIK